MRVEPKFIFLTIALKGCWGIVFAHFLDGRMGGGKKFVWAVSQNCKV